MLLRTSQDRARSADALTLAKSALDTHEATSGPNHPWTKDSVRVTADALEAVGRTDEASVLRSKYSL